MKLLTLLETLRRNLKTVILVSYAVLALVVIGDIVRLVFGHAHEAPAGEAAVAHGAWMSLYHVAETVPGFWAVFGLLGCLVLVLVSKTYGHSGVSKREDFYDE